MLGFNLRKAQVKAGAVALLAALTVAGSPSSYSAEVGAVPQELQQKYAEIQKLIQEGAPADTIRTALYWPELINAGEGKPTYRDQATFAPAFVNAIAHLGKDCAISLAEPAVVGTHIAGVYSQFHCTYADKPDLDLRVLYVWQKRGNEWKVALEGYNKGKM